MIRRAKYTLITSEILGFFLIVTGIAALVTQSKPLFIGFFVIFSLIVITTAMFIAYMVFAHKEHRKNKLHLNKRS